MPNGAVAALKVWEPSASRPTRRRFGSGRDSGTFRTARDGCEHLPLPAKSDTQFRATAPHRSSASIPIPATKSSTRNFTRACLTGVARSSTASPALDCAVVDLGLPDFFNHMIPLVEASFQTPVSNTLSSGTVTTGTISPGVILRAPVLPSWRWALIPHQSAKRHQRRRHCAVASLPRRHFSLDHWATDIWQHHRFREADVWQPTMKQFFFIASAFELLASRLRPH